MCIRDRYWEGFCDAMETFGHAVQPHEHNRMQQAFEESAKKDLKDRLKLRKVARKRRRKERDEAMGGHAGEAEDDEDESDGPGEHMSVLFELLPFYRQGDASTDAVVNRAVSATLQDDLRAVDDEGATPLVVCAQYGHEDLVEALLERGADVDAAAHSGCTALVYACGASQASFSERLVEKLLDLSLIHI